MSSVVQNELLQWVDNEMEQISTGLVDGSMSIEDACRFMKCVRRKIAESAGNDGPSYVPYNRHTVSAEDSNAIESVRRDARSQTANTDETALVECRFADEGIAQKYIADHLRRCIALVESGELSNVPSVASIADSLCILARELAMEPCISEGHFRFYQFNDSGTDDEYLKLFNVTRLVENARETTFAPAPLRKRRKYRRRRLWQMRVLDLETGDIRTRKKRLTKLEAAMVLEEWPAKRLNALVFFVPDWADCSIDFRADVAETA